MTNRTYYKTTQPRNRSNQPELILARPYREPRWWAPLWRGLVVDPTAKHYRAIQNSIWVFVYLVVHADRATGVLRRKLGTIAKEMGIQQSAVQYYITKLRWGGYITTKNTGRYLEIKIEKWKPIGRRQTQ